MASFISQNRVYGEKSLESFAGKMNLAYTTLHEYAQMYERVKRVEISARAEILSAIRAGKLTTTHIASTMPPGEAGVVWLTERREAPLQG